MNEPLKLASGLVTFPEIRPIIPERRRGIFEHSDWLYEVKHDGFRALAYLEQGRCRLVSRNGNQMKRFEDVCVAMGKELKVNDAVLDGEVAAVDKSRMPAFYDLMKQKRQAVYFAFDLLWLNGKDLRDLPLLERKKILRSVIPQKSTWIGYVSYVDEQAAKLFELVKARDLEGLVVKRKDGKYRSETRWYKVLNPAYSQKAGRPDFFQTGKRREA
jgi:bifunctional non-homologous end joining protein LigD